MSLPDTSDDVFTALQQLTSLLEGFEARERDINARLEKEIEYYEDEWPT
jgi:hypothetical protein